MQPKRRKFFILLPIVLIVVMLQAACSPAQIQTIIADVQAAVQLATSVLSVAQAFGALNTPQDQADIATATKYAQQISDAASKAVTEAASNDPLQTKVDTIYGYFAPIAPISPILNQKIKASTDLLLASVKLLVAQLKANGAGTPAPAAAPAARAAAMRTGPSGLALPFTMKSKMMSIKKQADKNVAVAAHMLLATR